MFLRNTKLQTTISSIAALALMSAFSGCTSQGYSGAALPSSEVSHISFANSGKVSLSSVEVDDRPLSVFSSAVEVLPGEHGLVVDYRYEEENCQTYDDYCYSEAYSGRCTGDIKTLPGRSYLVTIVQKYNLISATVLPKGYFDFGVRDDEGYIGGLVCQEYQYPPLF